jgi:recombinational DNA repair protein (RecF pathway)
LAQDGGLVGAFLVAPQFRQLQDALGEVLSAFAHLGFWWHKL